MTPTTVGLHALVLAVRLATTRGTTLAAVRLQLAAVATMTPTTVRLQLALGRPTTTLAGAATLPAHATLLGRGLAARFAATTLALRRGGHGLAATTTTLWVLPQRRGLPATTSNRLASGRALARSALAGLAGLATPAARSRGSLLGGLAAPLAAAALLGGRTRPLAASCHGFASCFLPAIGDVHARFQLACFRFATVRSAANPEALPTGNFAAPRLAGGLGLSDVALRCRALLRGRRAISGHASHERALLSLGELPASTTDASILTEAAHR